VIEQKKFGVGVLEKRIKSLFVLEEIEDKQT